ncbi:hypothetical protein BOX15_Mlig030741g1 [Macrostomum lignano]|uniref:Uncharacterized protein n=1 Tax=Macrostomum lignano TaxID=282301 RepID=A0A267FBU7_9PLAT|nr:hypothetical protein BOX15_Mlig030741g1 [Macrostomum lignano]
MILQPIMPDGNSSNAEEASDHRSQQASQQASQISPQSTAQQPQEGIIQQQQPAAQPAAYRPQQARMDQRKKKKSSETVKLLISEFNDYGHRTTVHGLGHMYQSTDVRRKLFWLLITIVGCFACGIHIYFIVANYNETPVNSVILNGGVHVNFPDVTLCNMYPISESVQNHGAGEIRGHIRKYWRFFRGFIKASAGMDNSTKDRFKMARKFFQIFWASEDTRDLAHDDDLFLVYCRYKSRPCSNKQFKMVQNIDYWNCYTFTPKFDGEEEEDRRVYSGNEDEGLNLIMYTNSHLRNIHASNALTTTKGFYDEENNGKDSSNGDKSNYLERYLVNYNLSLNQLLAGDKMEPDGIRVILHEKGTYPHMDMNSVIVGNGDYSKVVFSMERKISKNRPDFPCRETSEDAADEEVEYVSYYPGVDVRYTTKRPPPNFKKFKRDRLDYVVTRVQDLFWSSCSCYTHVVPFSHFNSKLCYFCRNGRDPVEIRRTLERVHCHDRVYQNQLKKNILTYFSDSQRFQPCTGDEYDVKMGSSAWPSQRDIMFLVDQYVIPAFLHESVGNRSYNSILKNTRVYPIRDIIGTTPEQAIGSKTIKSFNWTVDEFLIRKSFLKVAIHADSPTGTLNEEVESYSFAEALSEIGGIFGLYAGVSLLTFFEFVELAYLMATKPKEVTRHEKDGKSKFAMLQQTMEDGELPASEVLKYKQLFDRGNCCALPTASASQQSRSFIMQAEREGSVRRPVIVS